MKVTPQHSTHREGETHSGNFIQRAVNNTPAEEEELPFISAKRLGVQPKLTIGAPNDPYEQEADAMAEHVMRMPLQQQTAPAISRMHAGYPVQRMCSECEEEMQVQRMCSDCEEEMAVQRSGGGGSEMHASSHIANRLQSRHGQGSPLPSAVQTHMGQSFGTDFSNVRVHTDSEAAQMSQDLNAQAFTHGSDIYFNQGKYDPASSGGKRLLAHELTHTVQQNSCIRSEVDEIESINANKKYQKEQIQPNLTTGQLDEAVLQRQLRDPSEFQDSPEGWYLDVEPPGQMISQGTRVNVSLNHVRPPQPGFPSVWYWRNPEFGWIDSEGRRHPEERRLVETNSYPLTYTQSFDNVGRRQIYFRGTQFIPVPSIPAPSSFDPNERVIERTYSIQVVRTEGRSVLDLLQGEDAGSIDREDERALESSGLNQMEIVNLFKRRAIRRALLTLSENKAQVLQLINLYTHPDPDSLSRIERARRIHAAYYQMRERQSGLEIVLRIEGLSSVDYERFARAGIPHPGLDPVYLQQQQELARTQLDRLNPQIRLLEEQYPELHASYRFYHTHPNLEMSFEGRTIQGLRDVGVGIDTIRTWLLTGEKLEIFRVPTVINRLLQESTPRVKRVIRAFQHERDFQEIATNAVIAGISIPLLFLPGGAFISAAFGLLVDIYQLSESAERATITEGCSRAGVTSGICTEEEVSASRREVIDNAIWLASSIVDFVGEAADLVRVIGAARAASRGAEPIGETAQGLSDTARREAAGGGTIAEERAESTARTGPRRESPEGVAEGIEYASPATSEATEEAAEGLTRRDIGEAEAGTQADVSAATSETGHEIRGEGHQQLEGTGGQTTQTRLSRVTLHAPFAGCRLGGSIFCRISDLRENPELRSLFGRRRSDGIDRLVGTLPDIDLHLGRSLRSEQPSRVLSGNSFYLEYLQNVEVIHLPRFERRLHAINNMGTHFRDVPNGYRVLRGAPNGPGFRWPLDSLGDPWIIHHEPPLWMLSQYSEDSPALWRPIQYRDHDRVHAWWERFRREILGSIDRNGLRRYLNDDEVHDLRELVDE